MLELAESHGWTAAELESAVQVEPSTSLRRRAPPVLVSAIRWIECAVVEQDFALPGNGRIDELDAEAIVDLHASVMRIRERVDQLQSARNPMAHAVRRKPEHRR
jgi:hypothetical protein